MIGGIGTPAPTPFAAPPGSPTPIPPSVVAPATAFKVPAVRSGTVSPGLSEISEGDEDEAASAAKVDAADARGALTESISKLTDKQKDLVDTIMKQAFDDYMNTYGLPSIESGEKTEEEVGLEAARASLTAGTHFVNTLVDETVVGPKEPTFYETGTDEELRKLPAGIPAAALDRGNHPLLEYYRITSSKEGLPGFDAMIQFIAMNYQSKEWKENFIRLLNAYETRRINQFWSAKFTVTNLNARGKNAQRAARIPKPGDRNPNRMPLLDRAAMRVDSDTNNLVVIPPIKGDSQRFLNALFTLEKLSLIAIVDNPSDRRPKVLVKNTVSLVFMPPFFAPAIDINNEDNRRENIALYSMYLELEAANQGFVFMLSEQSDTNYTMGRVLNAYRGQETGYLVNLLDPTYIYTDTILLSAAKKGEIHIGYKNAGSQDPPPIFRYEPTESAGKRTVIRTSAGPDLTKPAQMTLPAAKDKQTCSGLYIGMNKLEHPMEPMYMVDTLVEKQIVSVLLVVRLAYTTENPICSFSPSKLVQIPKPPDVFYGTKRAKTVGVPMKTLVLTEEDEYLPRVEDKPVFQVRVPTAANSVMEDWYKGIYTDDEANFLNGLGLKPAYLRDIFKDETYSNWRIEVAQFLNGLVVSNCYSDSEMSGLLLSGECKQNRAFLDRVRSYYTEKGITAQSLQHEHDVHINQEFQRYFDEVSAAAAQATPKDFDKAGMNLEPITATQFLERKKQMDILFIEYVGKTGEGLTQIATQFMVVPRTSGGQQTYYELRVPLSEYEADPQVMYKKVDILKEKNPAHTFIY
jgi:hypothetical protein